jgi:UDP-2,3-diacylglucosamine pyrophosphatase LpxH
MDKLDQLHVVSDLHLGGAPGRQGFNQGAALAAVIDHLASVAAGRVGLVLNGDIVDFIAAEDAAYLDPAGAVGKLEAVLADPAFEPVWSALGRFVHTEGRVLALVLGNHDVELALPPVQDRLLAQLDGGDPAARGRIRIAMDGAGYACTVGGRRVLCVHGNDVDPWNGVDHGALLRVAAAINGGNAPPAWAPNAGTRLVVDVMNTIKETYPFVELLKPPGAIIPTILVALPAPLHAPLLDFARVMLRLAKDASTGPGAGFLSGGAPTNLPPPTDGYRALEMLMRQSGGAPPGAGVRGPPGGGDEGRDLLRKAEQDFASGLRPVDAADLDGGGDGMLGAGGLLVDRLLGRDPAENLREALARLLDQDRSFELDTRDYAFVAHDARVAQDVAFVLAGHTHQERAVPRAGGGMYYNSGTWMRVLRITPQALASREAFAPVYQALAAGTLADLDALPGLVLERRTVVSIWVDAGTVKGELRHARPAPHAGDAPAVPPWDPVPGTQHGVPVVEA